MLTFLPKTISKIKKKNTLTTPKQKKKNHDKNVNTCVIIIDSIFISYKRAKEYQIIENPEIYHDITFYIIL